MIHHSNHASEYPAIAEFAILCHISGYSTHNGVPHIIENPMPQRSQFAAFPRTYLNSQNARRAGKSRRICGGKFQPMKKRTRELADRIADPTAA